MVQTMETWIVADLAALQGYDGQRCVRAAIPAAVNLETAEKWRVSDALHTATERTQKGASHKTKHAPDLLAKIDPEQVRKRCPACDRFFRAVGDRIRAA